MTNFERLHPALQHHIVNSLGWRELRPFQEAVIPPILAGSHLIILAPTAGGKTEAAFFPALSRMLAEGWSGLSILYICPIKALLNNLDSRLHRYCELVGRCSALWHGDVKQTPRRRILREPPDCLLTTPESLEVMLISPRVDSEALFRNLQLVIVDEIHAFAGDDRGWHLLSVLERVSKLAGRELQRIGLSATVGNPKDLVEWLAGSCEGPRDIVLPEPIDHVAAAEVTLDYVGSLANAAIVISRLHRAEKRLVFVDSRSRAEQLAAELRRLEVTTFVTHSSLSQEHRHQAEHAFAHRENCVIVATSVLELGIDVGDLDRVIQIDSPPTVSSFLQRMGRTGRRPGTSRNCLFLATTDESLVQAAALLELWSSGYVEPVEPPPAPYHILAQQMMALTLQRGGVRRGEFDEWFGRVPAFASMSPERREEILCWMIDQGILWDEEGIVGFGRSGEETFGRRNFLELFSVFTSPPLFAVLHGRQELGFVDETTFLDKKEGPRVLLLGGRAWLVNYVDWQRKIAYVEASEAKGRSRWKGEGRALSYAMCQAIRQILAQEELSENWSRRARERIGEIRQEYGWLEGENSVVFAGGSGGTEWWTFAGHRANSMLVAELSRMVSRRVEFDNFSIVFDPSVELDQAQRSIDALRIVQAEAMRPAVEEGALSGLKFTECLPRHLALEMLEHRLMDIAGTRTVLRKPTRYVRIGGGESGGV
ncbi:MAG: DEAD/DEAH box helicase [Isosphaeraceae bacterium]|nr:DEAD/DEAH box helicase [Isosphaeraceae bacterium]